MQVWITVQKDLLGVKSILEKDTLLVHLGLKILLKEVY